MFFLFFLIGYCREQTKPSCLSNGVNRTLRIWSPSSSPSLAAGLSSKTPATKIPTSFPPANRRPTLSPFLNLTSFILGLQENTGRQVELRKKGHQTVTIKRVILRDTKHSQLLRKKAECGEKQSQNKS